jgi:pentatricopeptide repeat protein
MVAATYFYRLDRFRALPCRRYDAAIRACGEGGDLEGALSLFAEMRDRAAAQVLLWPSYLQK